MKRIPIYAVRFRDHDGRLGNGINKIQKKIYKAESFAPIFSCSILQLVYKYSLEVIRAKNHLTKTSTPRMRSPFLI